MQTAIKKPAHVHRLSKTGYRKIYTDRKVSTIECFVHQIYILVHHFHYFLPPPGKELFLEIYVHIYIALKQTAFKHRFNAK